MKKRTAALVSVCFSAGALGALGCGASSDTPDPTSDTIDTSQDLLIGDHLSGISDADFSTVKAAFVNVEDVNDGLGPIFNEAACGNCHNQGATGGAGAPIERRFGRFDNGVFNPLANEGGSLRQLFNNRNQPGFNNASCNVPLEREPADATVHNVGRLTTPTFGLGLVDAMPDSFFDGLVAAEPAAQRGTVNRGQIVLPNPGDSGQSIGTTRVTRFGWKAGVPSMIQFAADAYVNEMGISTQHCSRGTAVTGFAVESAPNGVPVSANCDDRAPRQTGTNPGGGLTATQWAQVDDAVGSCAGGRSEVQDDVFLFAVFMSALAPGPRDLSDQISVTRGQPLFSQVGCNNCHTPTTFRTPASPANVSIDAASSEFVRVPGNFAFNP